MTPEIEAAKPAATGALALLADASMPVRATVAILFLASMWTWLVTVVKSLQLVRLRALEESFSHVAASATDRRDLFQIARDHKDAAGGRVIAALRRRPAGASLDRLRAAADRVLTDERHRAGRFMTTLGSVAAAAPFVGLFGTVYGIMDAFARIGTAQSASLQVVAPAIGEALITTAIGLVTAIPALVIYNALDKRIGDYLAEVESSAAEWVAVLADLRTPWEAGSETTLPIGTSAPVIRFGGPTQ
ncbi:MAG: MotA/TolQ/ExbB proton channel family protein [Polyangiales bacterium]